MSPHELISNMWQLSIPADSIRCGADVLTGVPMRVAYLLLVASVVNLLHVCLVNLPVVQHIAAEHE